MEIWDEEKQVSNIMCDIEDTEDDLSPSKCPSMPTDMSVQFNKPGILTNWLIAFLLVIKGKYHLTDRVVNLVFKFLKLFLEIAGRFSSFCRILAEHFPSTLYKAQKLHEYKHNFKRYVVCKRCHRLYHFQDCIEEVGMQKRSRVCWYRQFGREECKGLLLKSVELCSGKRIFYPYVTYCFLGIKSPLQSMLNRPDFVDLCEEWRVRSVHDNVIADIYDGETWKKFQFVDGKPFLSEPFSYGMMISVDWFQPFKHLTYSVGVVFLTIMNLPRALRYHQENVILADILPGPREPHLTMNSYLEPLVDELLHFWNGVEMDTTVGKKLVRCAVMCASCDLPAGRKLCGFLEHAAFLGCSKCKKGFPGSIGQKDYSGFDRENWPRRTDQSHRRDTAQLLNCKSMKQLKEKELSLGCRYSCLLKLPYFDAPRMLAVDPMHNLFCGTAKYYVHHIWLKHSLLTSANFEVIQDRINRTVIPPDVGRIPSKILSGFSSLTADQLKNWTVYYSLIALRGMLIGDDLEVWRHFVLACRILCCREITREKLRLADALLLKFCKRTERMYGKECVTPNMHMHCHLRECIEDYGPIAAFWLFPYERFNGILGEMPNNNRSIEIQLMKRFLCDQEVLSISLPDEFHEEFSPYLGMLIQLVLLEKP